MTDIRPLPDKWRRDAAAHRSILDSTAALRLDVCADELQAELPVWTKISDDPDSWPEEGQQVLTKTGWCWFYGDFFRQWIGTWWRPCCDIDTPPE